MSDLPPVPKPQTIENLLVDATMTLTMADPNIPGGGGENLPNTNMLGLYVRVRDAQGEGVVGLEKANFLVQRLSPGGAGFLGEALVIESAETISATTPAVHPGSYVLTLGKPTPNPGLQEYAFLVQVTESSGPLKAIISVGQKLVSTAWSPT
jgi:hypothetical protein